MNTENQRQKDLIDTTDCLEAISVFKGWKNLFFVITLIALLVIQLGFWSADLGLAKGQQDKTQEVSPTHVGQVPQQQAVEVEDELSNIEQAAEKVTSDVNVPATKEKPEKAIKPINNIIKTVHIMWTIRAADFVIIFSSILYCLTILFCLKISLIGRLGGINHISRAFFISLIMLVLLLPWQTLFGWFVTGAVFEPSELKTWLDNYTQEDLLGKIWYYLRFVGYWFIIFLLLLCAQLRSVRWARATLRRLEVV